MTSLYFFGTIRVLGAGCFPQGEEPIAEFFDHPRFLDPHTELFEPVVLVRCDKGCDNGESTKIRAVSDPHRFRSWLDLVVQMK